MGTPDFALPTLEALIRHGKDVVTIVTQPDRPKGRGKKMTAPPVKQLALDHKIEILQPEKASDAHFCDLIEKKEPDLLLTPCIPPNNMRLTIWKPEFFEGS